MARTQSPDYDQRREAILERAAGLFASKGFQGASIADLGHACHVSKSLIYHYYPSKEDILYEVMAAHLGQLVESAEAVTQRSDLTPDARLRALTGSFMRLYAGAANSHKVLLNELDNLPARRRAEVVAKQRRIIAIVEDQLRAIRPGIGPAAFPVAMLFFGMINWTHSWFRADGAVTPETLAEMAVALTLEGLGGVPLS